MGSGRTASRVMGVLFGLPGAWLCLISLSAIIRMAWDIWKEGAGPDLIMIGTWDITLTQFFIIAGVVFAVGAALLGGGILFFFRSPHEE